MATSTTTATALYNYNSNNTTAADIVRDSSYLFNPICCIKQVKMGGRDDTEYISCCLLKPKFEKYRKTSKISHGCHLAFLKLLSKKLIIWPVGIVQKMKF